jgi:hypothetical protein
MRDIWTLYSVRFGAVARCARARAGLNVRAERGCGGIGRRTGFRCARHVTRMKNHKKQIVSVYRLGVSIRPETLRDFART